MAIPPPDHLRQASRASHAVDAENEDENAGPGKCEHSARR